MKCPCGSNDTELWRSTRAGDEIEAVYICGVCKDTFRTYMLKEGDDIRHLSEEEFNTHKRNEAVEAWELKYVETNEDELRLLLKENKMKAFFGKTLGFIKSNRVKALAGAIVACMFLSNTVAKNPVVVCTAIITAGVVACVYIMCETKRGTN